MALITCPECDSQISSLAGMCPKCGFPMHSINPRQEDIIELSERRENETDQFKYIADLAQDIYPPSHPPVISGPDGNTPYPRVQTIEKTSKRLKLQMILSMFLTVISLIGLLVSSQFERDQKVMGQTTEPPATFVIFFLTLVAGILWFLFIRFKIWWHHG